MSAAHHRSSVAACTFLVLAAATADAFPFCDSAQETYALFQCANLSYFAPLPPGYAPSQVSGLFWQLGFGNAGITGGGTVDDGTGIGPGGIFIGNDSGSFTVNILDAHALYPLFPPGSLCLGSNNWANFGVDGCPDNPRVASFSSGGYVYQGDDNYLNPYFNIQTYSGGYPGLYTRMMITDYPTAVLLTTADGAWFALAAVTNMDRGNDGSGGNGPCADPPGTNPAPCDIRQSAYDFKDITDGLPNQAVPGRNDVIPWQPAPAPFFESSVPADPNDPGSGFLVDLSWPSARLYSDLSVKPSTNPGMGPADPNSALGAGVQDLEIRHGSLVRSVLEVAALGDPGFTSPLQTIRCPGDPACTSATTASFATPAESCVRIRTLFGTPPRTPVHSREDCRLGRCGDLGYEVVSGRVCFLANCTPQAEICDGIDNDCDANTDEDFLVGTPCEGEGACGTGVIECAGLGATRCSTDPGGSADGSSPEQCDGIDSDCDGATDEDFMAGLPCDGEGECGAGIFNCIDPFTSLCSTNPGGWQDQSVPEFCDGLDNDCDGVTDENAVGEVCDGLDNDCDFAIDEDFGVGNACDGVGECGAGVRECSSATTSRCSTEPGGSYDGSSPELCDGLDNDCDAATDEPFGTGQICTGTGACGTGILECSGPSATRCSTSPGGSQDQSGMESCDALDNDCDGATDEDWFVGAACFGTGTCGSGLYECLTPTTNICSSDPGGSQDRSRPEKCDSFDNDCDGLTDEGEPEPDADGDGVPGACDNCPADANPAQDDLDADAVGDLCDNCESDFNSHQEDDDLDAEGDACDIDDGVIHLNLPDGEAVEYQVETGFGSFNIYRSELGVLLATGQYTQDPATVAGADRFCGESGGLLIDPEGPAPAGALYFYLISGVDALGEYGLGSDGTGTARPNDNPCP